MKKLFIAVLLLVITTVSFGQTSYEKIMLTTIDTLYKSFGAATIQQPVNTFERLAQADTTRWEPLYYAAYAYCMMSLQEKDNNKKDAFCDKAQELLNKALAKSPNESELYVLQGFLYNMRLLVNPMSRANSYMGQINNAYATAEHLNPANPRVYYMRANMIMNMPAFMGGGKDKALPVFMIAKEKFDTFTSPNVLAPRWGKDDCYKKIEECSK